MNTTSKQTEAGHTPGPWETGAMITRVEVLPEGWNMPMCIADCHTKNAPSDESERCANARLIAAAPELLAALEAVAGSLDSCLRSKTSEKIWREVAFLNREFVLAAITQAKGTK